MTLWLPFPHLKKTLRSLSATEFSMASKLLFVYAISSFSSQFSPPKHRVRSDGKSVFILLIFFLGTRAAAPRECGKGRPHELDCQPFKGRFWPFPAL